MRQKLLIGAGFLMLLLGGIGIVLPVWPTTPFVLVAAGCFSSSPKLSGWLCKNSFFREYIEHYRCGGGITKATLCKSLLFLWGMLALSACLVRRPLVWAVLMLVGVGVTLHILAISRKRNQP